MLGLGLHRFHRLNEVSDRVVKQSSDLWTSNFKFEFVFVFQPFDIQIQASLIRRRWFCLESEALKLFSGALCEDFFVLCQLSVQATPAVCLLTPPLPSLHTAMAFNYSPFCTAPLAHVVYPCKLSKWQILVAQTKSRHQLTAIEHNMAWCPGWLHCL